MGSPTLAITTLLIATLAAPPIAGQPGTTSKPHMLTYQQRLRRAEAQKQARRWVTFLELPDRRPEGADGLLKMGADAIPALLLALDDPRPDVVQRVAHILRALGSHAAAAKGKLIALSNSKDPKLANAARYALAGIQPAGITLVADFSANQVKELDKTGKLVRKLTGVRGPWDAERLPGGNYLICGYAHNKVVEMTATGKVVWSFAKLKEPRKAQRLPSGNTLIADGGGKRVVEVDRAGKIVWKYDKGPMQPFDVERLVNGNTLIADTIGFRVIEVTAKGEIAWQYKHGQIAHSAHRLPNGNTLITIAAKHKVIEVTPKGKVAHELKGLRTPLDAYRLPNGHTLVAQQGEVAEYDAKGKRIWRAKMSYPGEVKRY